MRVLSSAGWRDKTTSSASREAIRKSVVSASSALISIIKNQSINQSIRKRVVSASHAFVTSAMCVPSTFETKCTLRSRPE